MLFYIYLIFLELSSALAYICSWLSWHPNVVYLWSQLCLDFAGCQVFFLEKSHNLSLYEENGCLFLSTRANNNEDLYTTAIDTYVTNGWALALTPYSYLTTWWYDNYEKPDLSASLAKTYYYNAIVYPEIVKEDGVSFYINFAWKTKMSIQIILTHHKEAVLNIKKREAAYGINLYCYRSEVIRPKYFSTFEEFAEYVELIWREQLENIQTC
jgi:hypothetical protein